MSTQNKHFDCLKNKLPENWLNSNATKHYNNAYWKKCDCEKSYGAQTHAKEIADKWDPNTQFIDKWSKPHLGLCCENKKCEKKDCEKCKSSCQVLTFGPCFPDFECPDVVDFKYPMDGTKALYLSKFSPEFRYANRYQCAIPAQYNCCVTNVIDNLREEEFTVSDQASLVQRGIKNQLLARTLPRYKMCHSVPASWAGNGTYYYLGTANSGLGSTFNTGLVGQQVTGDPRYFGNCYSCE